MSVVSIVREQYCETLNEGHRVEERNSLRNIVSQDSVFNMIDSWLEDKTNTSLHKL